MGIIQHSKGQVDVRTGFDLAGPTTLEAWVVRVSDSVAYLNHDLDDALRAGIVSPSDIPQRVIDTIGGSHAQRINSLIMDIIENSTESRPAFSPFMLGSIETLRGFLFSSVYSHANAQIEDSRVDHVLRALFGHRIEKCKDDPQRAADFISGMTDRFALQLFQDIYVPSPWPKGRTHLTM